jgi:hypothetical protein
LWPQTSCTCSVSRLALSEGQPIAEKGVSVNNQPGEVVSLMSLSARRISSCNPASVHHLLGEIEIWCPDPNFLELPASDPEVIFSPRTQSRSHATNQRLPKRTLQGGARREDQQERAEDLKKSGRRGRTNRRQS